MRVDERPIATFEHAEVDRLDPAGVSCLDHVAPGPAALPGLPPGAVLVTVERVVDASGSWAVWGCLEGRPLLFSVDALVGAELMAATEAGERPTAIVEPAQILGQALD